jgi:hypothetical protein
VDLDWFWRGWFYTTDHCDISLDKVEWLVADDRSPDQREAEIRRQRAETLPTLSEERNKPLPKLVDQIPDLKDFYNSYDPLATTPQQREAYDRMMASLTDTERQLLAKKSNYYVLHFSNVGGLIMPIIFLMEFEDGTTQEVRLPAEVWRVDSTKFSKMVVTEKKVVRFELDPRRETADADRNNNHFPPELEPTRFEVFKGGGGFSSRGRRPTPSGGEAAVGNPMREAQRGEEQKRQGDAPPKTPKADAEGEKKTPEKKDAEVKEPQKESNEKKSEEKKSEEKKDTDKKDAELENAEKKEEAQPAEAAAGSGN